MELTIPYLPDMIEVGSFIGMAAMTQSEITIKNVRVDQLGIIPDVFRRLGIKMEIQKMTSSSPVSNPMK
jgi:UDP-N-acetylglucosamine 1-carboxyvinyltransferase